MSDTENVEEAPKSFWEQAREAKQNREGWVKYFITMATITSLSAVGTCLMVIALVIPVIAFIVGIMKYDQCPLNSWIPVYLIVVGLLGITSSTFALCRQCTKNEKVHLCLGCLQVPLSLLWLAFFVAGNIWVYGSISEVDTERNSTMVEGKQVPNPDYCHPWVYWLAFFMITIVYVCMILGCCFCCGTMCYLARAQKGEEETPIVDAEQKPSDQ